MIHSDSWIRASTVGIVESVQRSAAWVSTVMTSGVLNSGLMNLICISSSQSFPAFQQEIWEVGCTHLPHKQPLSCFLRPLKGKSSDPHLVVTFMAKGAEKWKVSQKRWKEANGCLLMLGLLQLHQQATWPSMGGTFTYFCVVPYTYLEKLQQMIRIGEMLWGRRNPLFSPRMMPPVI